MVCDRFKQAISEALIPEYDGMISDTSEHSFSPKFEKRMRKLINRQKKPYYLVINTVGKRAACIIAALLIVFTTAVINVEALRSAFHGFFIYSDGKRSAFELIDSGDAPQTIEDIYEITYDLSGYEKEVWFDTEHHRSTHYIKDDLYYVGLTQQIKAGVTIIETNTRDSAISTITIGEHEAVYFCDKNNYDMLIWENGDYIFTLKANLGKDALIEIAESLKKVEK